MSEAKKNLHPGLKLLLYLAYWVQVVLLPVLILAALITALTGYTTSLIEFALGAAVVVITLLNTEILSRRFGVQRPFVADSGFRVAIFCAAALATGLLTFFLFQRVLESRP